MDEKYVIECFCDDADLLKYFDPLSCSKNNEEAAKEICKKIIEYEKEYSCKFVKMECGYFFYIKPRWFFQKRALVSFCLRSKFRTHEWRAYFWMAIKAEIGSHFSCYLFNKNKRAINFLVRNGMKIKNSNNLVTLLII